MPLDISLSLKQAAILSIAKRFWDLPQMKKRVLTFAKDSVGIHEDDARHRWMELIEELLTAWNTYALPIDLKRYLLYTIKEVGQRIFDLFGWITPKRKFVTPSDYSVQVVAMIVSSIRWTPCGIIDEFKTYQILSEMYPNFDIVKLYKVACMHAMEDQIEYLWRRMSESERKSLQNIRHPCHRCIVAYWKYRRDNSFDAQRAFLREWKFNPDDLYGEAQSMDPYYFKTYNENLSLDENMILISIQHGLINSVKYFWERLPEDHRNTKLFDYLHLTLIIYVEYKTSYDSLTNYRKERLARVYVFFVSQMNDDHRELFRRTTTAAAIFEDTYKINVSKMEWSLRPAWPWHNFLSLGLKDLIQCRKFSTGLAYFLLCELTRNEVEQFKEGLVVNGSEVQRLIQEIWKTIPSNQKEYVIEPWVCDWNYNGKYFISNLIDARDFETLRMIVNESGDDYTRDELVREVLNKCVSLVKTDDYELLEELINQLATSSEERLSFRKRVDCLDDFIETEEYDLADKLLNWKCWEPQMNEYTKMLRVKDLKNEFKYHWPPEKRICMLWVKFSKNIDEAMQRSSRYMNWMFMTKLKRDKFIKRKLISTYSKNFFIYFKLSTEIIEKFYFWCDLVQKEPL